MEYKEGDLVLCTVTKIERTTVFVKLPNNEEGTIIINEIAPGRIRNIRQYVVPNKKIPCKILRIKGGHLDLSLRRVSAKEKKEVLDNYKQEQSSKSALHQILKDDAKKVEEKILKDYPSIFEFLVQARNDPKLLEKYIPKKYKEAIEKITKKKQKQVEIQKILTLKCFKEDVLKRIKTILKVNQQNTKIRYLGAGKFQLTLKEKNYKIANQNLNTLIKEIESKAQKNSCEININNKK